MTVERDETVAIIADIGGTNARFALVKAQEMEPFNTHTLAVDDYDTIEAAINAYLRMGDGWVSTQGVSVERLLSGIGLSSLHRALACIRGERATHLTPAQITRGALENSDSLCLEVLDCFCGLLDSVAGNTALTLGAQGGVYITGGIVPRMLSFLATSEFRHRFEDKGRYQRYMAAIPTHVVTARQPGLLGAAALLRTAGAG